MKTTLEAIRKHSPCKEGWEKLLKHLGKTKADSAPLDLLTVLESNGLGDTLWCLRAVEGHEEAIRRLACDFALSAAHLWDVPVEVRRYLEHPTEGARGAAQEVAWAAEAAWEAGSAWVAGSAWAAARAAAAAASWTVAWAAEAAAVWAAEAGSAWAAETAPPWAAAWAAEAAEEAEEAEKGKQLIWLKKLLEETR